MDCCQLSPSTPPPAMPRWIRFKKEKEPEFLPEQRPVARAELKDGALNMLEGDLDAAFTSPQWPVSPIINNQNGNSALPDSVDSTPSTTRSFAEIQGNHKKSVQLVSPEDSHSGDSSIQARPSDLSFLQFRPTENTNYARVFARAVLEGYRSNLISGVSQRDRVLAERVVQGEGKDLIFRPAYIATNTVWNGQDPRLRRATLTHILGIASADCNIDDCPYRGSSCVGCEDPQFGVFEGCRHSHESPKKLGCANCCVGAISSDCSVRSERKDSKDIHRESTLRPRESRVIDQEQVIRQRESRAFVPSLVDNRPRMRSSHALFQDLAPVSESQKRAASKVGPVLNQFFVGDRDGKPNDFDIWMAMRKRAIDYDPEMLEMECRLAKLWSNVLEDERGKQKAVAFRNEGAAEVEGDRP